jgi:hypothetical protein
MFGARNAAVPSVKSVLVERAVRRKIKPFPVAVWGSNPRAQNVHEW